MTTEEYRDWHEPPPAHETYEEKLERWKEGWNRELDDDLENGR
jgi:hypothetical protein